MLTAALQHELERRRQRNPRYSLRAYGRDLGVHHATLSQLLRGRRPMSAAAARLLGRALGLASHQIDAACAAADDDALVAAVRREDFRPDSQWLATRSGRDGRLTMPSAERWESHA
jgi:DNA-binding transcriptional regulator YdaS (Cro superfamily)